MNLGRVKQRVVDNTSRTDKTDTISELIESGLREIQRHHDFRSLREIVSTTVGIGDYSIPIPAGTHKMFRVILVNGVLSREITLYAPARFKSSYPTPEVMISGIPCIGTEEGSTITIVPPSNAEYEIRIARIKLLAIPLDDLSTFPIPGLDEFLVAYATAGIFLVLGNMNMTNLWSQQYAMKLAGLIKEDMNQPEIFQAGGLAWPEGSITVAPWLDPFAGRM